MRQVENPQLQLGQTPVDQINIDPKSRDDIPVLLLGLKHIYTTPELRERVFDILKGLLPHSRVPDQSEPRKADPKNGRPGMDQWRILVLGTLRLGLNADFDRVHELANNHPTIRQMLGHSDDWRNGDPYKYTLNTIKDNVQLFTPEILDQVNQEVVRAGHRLLSTKKSAAGPIVALVDDATDETASQNPEQLLHARCDSFVVETDVHFPTDITVLFDAIRKTLEAATELAAFYDIDGWRQSKYILRKLKKACREIARLKARTSQDEKKQQQREHQLKLAHLEYVLDVQKWLVRARETGDQARQLGCCLPRHVKMIEQIDHYGNYALLFCDQIRRRVVEREKIPHGEKVFSIFEPHTEWISKGKAGVPQELGLKVCIVEDQYQFILHHRVMVKEGDEEVAVIMIDESHDRFGPIESASFDKGFHSPANQLDLATRVERVVLPKKGKCSATEQQREQSEAFIKTRHQHSAVESAINGLEHTGLDRCPDHALDGFERYVGLAVLARNIKRLGTVVRMQERERDKRRAAAKLCRAA